MYLLGVWGKATLSATASPHSIILIGDNTSLPYKDIVRINKNLYEMVWALKISQFKIIILL